MFTNFVVGAEAFLLLVAVLAATPFVIVASPFLVYYFPFAMPALISRIRNYVKELESRIT